MSWDEKPVHITQGATVNKGPLEQRVHTLLFTNAHTQPTNLLSRVEVASNAIRPPAPRGCF